jgi:hypothetical protein
MANDWYPIRGAEKAVFHNTFAAETQVTGTAHGLTLADIDQIVADAESVKLAVNLALQVRSYAESMTAWKDALLSGDPNAAFEPPTPPPVNPAFPAKAMPGIEARTRRFAAIIRASVGYGASVGEAYQITTLPEREPELPALKAFPDSNWNVRLRLIKNRNKLLAVDCRRSDGEWEQIGVAMTIHYVDKRPPIEPGQAEKREYRVQGYGAEGRYGQYSGSVVVFAVP